MFQRLFQRFRGSKAPTFIDQRERDALIRENAEARGEALGRSNKEAALGDKSIDQVTAPGVVGDPTVLITRKVAEQRTRNKRPN
jgi:hypothetical protein